MDVGASTRNSKMKKRSTRKNNGNGENRISDLPDTVLHNILSMLPTKYAVRTTVLSMRWKHMWTSVDNLELCDEMLCNVVYIKKFSLSCKGCNASRVNAWISAAVSRKILQLVIRIEVDQQHFVFPRSLFKHDTFTELTLEMNQVPINIPMSITFSRLKILHLNCIQFVGEPSVSLHCLLCSILEELTLKNCTWPDIKTFNIFTPVFRILTIDGLAGDCEINVFAKHLISLNYELDDRSKYSLHILSIENAVIGVPIFDNVSDFQASLLMAFLQFSPNLESLIFPEGIHAHPFQEDDWIIEKLPLCLLSHLKSVELGVFDGNETEFRLIMFLLEN
ncbi:hypothetical protein GIB67_040089 [Kingdonia uniflora]|uniref:F-box domain-containing protein n=1 Tax=Kingdonia uniflora TaxID=39325 RepID=A0A7J7MUJ2_9MAGN|nr:hypothetical protein GIB67_040089 [Kingdonia uniflora]